MQILAGRAACSVCFDFFLCRVDERRVETTGMEALESAAIMADIGGGGWTS